mmetsp:Transcript_5849/g.13452  ORF Transcript_5849/g.13452 Transcript_5849/m.13452 type:complete len:313 (-) Transcript_5849:482-1420(-)
MKPTMVISKQESPALEILSICAAKHCIECIEVGSRRDSGVGKSSVCSLTTIQEPSILASSFQPMGSRRSLPLVVVNVNPVASTAEPKRKSKGMKLSLAQLVSVLPSKARNGSDPNASELSVLADTSMAIGPSAPKNSSSEKLTPTSVEPARTFNVRNRHSWKQQPTGSAQAVTASLLGSDPGGPGGAVIVVGPESSDGLRDSVRLPMFNDVSTNGACTLCFSKGRAPTIASLMSDRLSRQRAMAVRRLRSSASNISTSDISRRSRELGSGRAGCAVDSTRMLASSLPRLPTICSSMAWFSICSSARHDAEEL